MSKYGGSLVISPEIARAPEIIAVIEERALEEARRVGATDRFKFEVLPECLPFDPWCPMFCAGEDETHDHEWCNEEIQPHGHAWWSGWTVD